jgi:hypothetical protein
MLQVDHPAAAARNKAGLLNVFLQVVKRDNNDGKRLCQKRSCHIRAGLKHIRLAII